MKGYGHVRTLGLSLVGLALAVAACSSGGAAGEPPQQPLGLLATPLATESVAATPEPTERPSVNPAVTPKPTKKPGAKPAATPNPTKKPAANTYYRPRGWDGHSDVDCGDFDTYAHALSFFKGTGGSTTNDPYRLDRDHDAEPCETLP